MLFVQTGKVQPARGTQKQHSGTLALTIVRASAVLAKNGVLNSLARPLEMHRRNLKYLLLGLGALGLLAASAVFVQSLAPSAGTDAALPRVPTASIPPGGFQFVPDIYEQRPDPDHVMFVRTREGRLYAWRIPVRAGAYSLPDHHWWKPEFSCLELRPDFNAQVIHCMDQRLPGWAQERYRWRLDGKSLSDQVPDMMVMPGVDESGYFVFHKRSAV